MNTEKNVENCVEFITGTHTITCSFTSVKYANRMLRLYEENPQAFVYLHKNLDGSVCCKVPLSWLKITPPRIMSDEQRKASAERLQASRKNKTD